MSNMYGKDKFHDRQKAVLQKSAQKIENDSGWSQDNFLRGYAEEILPASGAELSFGELCAIGEQVEQEAAFSAKEAMRNKIKARRDAERYKSTGTDSEQRTPNPFEDSSAIATESPKNEDTLNTMRKHADAQPTKSAGIKTSKKQSLVETTRELKKYIHIISCGGVLYYHNEYYYTQLDAQIAELQSQYENVEQEDERSGTLDMSLIAQKLDEWQKASRNDVDRELVNSCVAQITPLTNEEYRWVLDFQLTEVQSGNSATCTLDGFMEMARFTISFEEAKAFKASRNQGIRKNEWHDLTVAVGIRTRT